MAEPLVATFPAGDGYPLSYFRYGAIGTPRAVVLCLHGIQSHAGWYGESCSRLSQAGFEVFFVERRGSGRATRDRGDCEGRKQLQDDVVRSVGFAREQCPGLPVALLAISWAGKLALAAIKSQPNLVDACVFICPGWFAKVEPTLKEKLAIAWGFLFKPRTRVRIPLSDPALFTANPQRQEYLRNDPLSLREGSARLLMASRVLDRVIRAAPEKIKVPCVLFLGGRDRIVANDRLRDYFERFASEDKSVIEYASAHHTLEFEPDPEPFFRDLVGWLMPRFPAR